MAQPVPLATKVLTPSDIAAVLQTPNKDLNWPGLSTKNARLYFEAYTFFNQNKETEIFIGRGGHSVNYEELQKLLEELQSVAGIDRNGVIAALASIIYGTPESAESPSTDQLATAQAAYEQYQNTIANIDEKVAKETQAEIDRLSRLVKIPPTAAKGEIDPDAISSTLVTNQLNQAVNSIQDAELRDQVQQAIKEHDTADKIAAHLSSEEVIGDTNQPLDQKNIEAAEKNIRAQIEHDLAATPEITAALVSTSLASIVPVRAVHQMAAAQKNGDLVLAAVDSPEFTRNAQRVQRTLDNLNILLSPQERDTFIEKTVSSLNVSPEQKVAISAALNRGTQEGVLALQKAGVSPQQLHALIGSHPELSSFAAAAGDYADTVRGTDSTGATQTVGGKTPSLVTIDPATLRVSPDGTLSAAVRNGHGPRFVNLVSRHTADSRQAGAVSFENTAILSKKGDITAFLKQRPYLWEIYQRANLANQAILTTTRQLERQVARSAVGRPIRQLNVLIVRTIPRQASAWIGKQAIVLAAKNTFKNISTQIAKKVAESAAAAVIKQGGKILAEIGATLTEAASGLALPLAIASAIDLLKNIWDLIQQILPLIKKFLDDHPWVPVLLLFAPFFPFFGPFGPALFALGALGIAALIASAGIGAVGAGVGGIIGTTFAFVFSWTILFPVVIAVVTFISLWIFLALFYELFILPQAFLGNPTNQPTMVTTATGQVLPAFFTTTTSTSPATSAG